jgi:hypothetical protein
MSLLRGATLALRASSRSRQPSAFLEIRTGATFFCKSSLCMTPTKYHKTLRV